MITNEENMMNKQDVETIFSVGESGILTRKEIGNWRVYHNFDRKLHHVTLFDIDVILFLGLHTKLFIMTQALQRGFRETSEGKA